ncbi:MAG: GTP 3',8-cyclase MoaA [Planctomycetota bacterium]
MSIALPILPPAGAEGRRVPPPAPSAALRPGRLIDSHGRTIRDLRLSVTDRCNYRCVYCMDPAFRYMPKQMLLSLEEYVTVARVCASLGIEKLRITGGEPTLYSELDALIAEISRLPYRDLAMTTNGSLLDQMPLGRWRRAGLRRITLSLDSLRPERVAKITRTSNTAETVINAIDIARGAGFDPIKVNAVLMRGFNDDEVADFADFARAHGINMRLIEFMPLDSSRAWSRADVVSADEMLAKISARHDLVPLDRDDPSSTSLNFSFADGSPGSIGIIASVTRPFCGACSRLRVTADGKVRPCLFSHEEWDLRPLLRNGASDEDLVRFLADSMWTKQAGHGIGSKGFVPPARTMSAIGG